MPAQGWYEVLRNRPLARDIWEMRLGGDTGAITRPGQFVNIRLDGLFLRRPMSVCSRQDGEMTIIYRVLGAGTRRMAGLAPGARLDLLTGLGNGFDLAPVRGRRIALVGGGCGLPPLYGAMEALAGEDVTCVMGFASQADVFYEGAFAALGARELVTTADGTRGVRGLVTDALRSVPYDYYLACGPEPMLRAVHALGREGQLSFEERMACGFGACMGCTCKTIAGYKRICADGPVLHSGEVCF